MSRSKPRKNVSVSKLAEFADNPEAFRKTRGAIRDPKVAAAGAKAHQDRVRSRHNGRRLVTAVVFVAIVAIVVLAIRQ
jgi:hypothetical protein